MMTLEVHYGENVVYLPFSVVSFSVSPKDMMIDFAVGAVSFSVSVEQFMVLMEPLNALRDMILKHEVLSSVSEMRKVDVEEEVVRLVQEMLILAFEGEGG